MRIFVVNVGVNSSDASKRGMRSPLFDDGSFEMVPIREGRRFASAPGVRRYSALPGWTNHAPTLAAYVPEKMRTYAAHDDPDFARMTYGDKLNGRAAALRDAAPGDLVLFLARLWEHTCGRFRGTGAFHLVGALFVTHNLEYGLGTRTEPPEAVRSRVQMNAHVLRDPAHGKEPFRILVGDSTRSARFQRPIAVTGEVASMLFGGTYSEQDGTFLRDGKPLRNKNGAVRQLKRFGSITRTIQWFLDDATAEDRASVSLLLSLVDSAGSAKPVGSPS